MQMVRAAQPWAAQRREEARGGLGQPLADAALEERVRAEVERHVAQALGRTSAQAATPPSVAPPTPLYGPGREETPQLAGGLAGPAGRHGNRGAQAHLLPTFDERVEHEGADAYLRACVTQLQAMNTAEEFWAVAILSRLTPSQASIARQGIVGRNPSFDELWQALTEVYPTPSDDEARDKLATMQRTAGEDLPRFARRIMGWRRASTTDAELRRALMRGLDRPVAINLMGDTSATFATLVTRARQIEQQSRSWDQGRETAAPAAAGYEGGAARASAEEWCGACGEVHPRGACRGRREDDLEKERKRSEALLLEVKKLKAAAKETKTA